MLDICSLLWGLAINFTEGRVSGTGACKLMSLRGCLEYLDLCAMDLWTLSLGVADRGWMFFSSGLGTWGACLKGG